MAALLPDVVFQLDPDGRWTYLNPAWTALTGRPIHDALARPWLEAFDARDHAAARAALDALLGGHTRGVQQPLRLLRANAEPLWVHATARAYLVDGHVRGAAGTLHDISALKDRETTLQHQALHDPLTGLPNRALLHDRLQQRAHRARRQPGELYAVTFLDLDDFKTINDTHGHHLGDLALTAAAHRLQLVARAADTVTRYGGDEFVILLDHIDHHADVNAFEQRVRDALSTPITLAGAELSLHASIGTATSDTPHTNPLELIDLADNAMYHAKRPQP